MSNIEDQLDRIERKLDTLLAALKSQPMGGGSRASAANNNGGGDIDIDIDGPRGDPEVRFMPKRWSGADFKGRKFSECDPEFLDMLADAYEWFAQRDDEQNAVDKNGAPKSKWSRLDAGRARAWANRLPRRRRRGPRARRQPSGGGMGRPSAPSYNGGGGYNGGGSTATRATAAAGASPTTTSRSERPERRTPSWSAARAADHDGA
ncbi:MAG: hypothetical protein R3A52_00210 [Polyangiales bacterium]